MKTTTPEFTPLNQPLDTLSAPRTMPPDAYRVRSNFFVGFDKRLKTQAGFSRLFDTTDNLYNNTDLHDQLVPAQLYYDETADGCDDTQILTHDNGVQPLTQLGEVISQSGVQYTFAACQSRIYEFNSSTRNWRILFDGLGGDERADLSVRFRFAGQINGNVIFTNNVDIPIIYVLGSANTGCNLWAGQKIPQLVGKNVFSASDVILYGNRFVLFNINVNGVNYPDGIIWCDSGRPLIWTPGQVTTTEDALGNTSITSISTANSQFLGGGRRILRASEIAGIIYVFTDQDIQRGQINPSTITTGTGDNAITIAASEGTFSRWYTPNAKENLLFFKNTLINFENVFYYVASNGIFSIGQFDSQPKYEEALTLAAGDMLAKIDRDRCDIHVGGVWGRERTVFISYAERGSPLPNRTFIFNPDVGFTSYLDYGVTVFGTLSDYQSQPTYRDFWRQYCVCLDSDSSTNFIKEGLPNPAEIACPTPPDCIFSNATVEWDDLGLVEDFAGTPSATSLCQALGGLTFDQLCKGACEGRAFLAAASASDGSLKQIGGYSRSNVSAPQSTAADLFVPTGGLKTSQGTYTLSGYSPRLVMGPLISASGQNDVLISRMELEFSLLSDSQSIGRVYYRTGTSHTALDVLDAQDCDVLWENYANSIIRCTDGLAAVHKARGTRPDFGIQNDFLAAGRYGYWEIIVGSDSQSRTPQPAIGVAVEPTSCRLTIEPVP